MRNKYILIAFFVLILAFIWGNSLLSAELSSQVSRAVGEFLAGILGEGDGVSTMGGVSVRKIAHFVEFAALGIVSSLILNFMIANVWNRVSVSALLGLFIALTDETIQIFSGRGSSVRDVWIDVSGYLFGCLIVFVVLLLTKNIKRKSEKQP